MRILEKRFVLIGFAHQRDKLVFSKPHPYSGVCDKYGVERETGYHFAKCRKRERNFLKNLR